ncbi:hypothetical protein KKA17_04835 [bacterium]|nr:hypothetical protein [bacterium]MBU1884278.1 hypothetical protein [bacterium]
MQKTVNSLKNGVNISFTGEVKKENVVAMVQNCQSGKCECMSDETKKKIKNMEVSGEDGDVNLTLSGDILKEEIEEALAKSKVINSQCC